MPSRYRRAIAITVQLESVIVKVKGIEYQQGNVSISSSLEKIN
jgi:hypothetical protein